MHEPIPVTRSSMPPMEEYVKEIAPIWENRWLTNMGSRHQRLERALCDFLKVPYMALFTNGHLALELALASMELTGEVITTPFTFASTTQAIVQNGLTPVFCDISPVDFTMDAAKIEALITPKTSAILPVHVYGNPCAVKEIEEIARKHGLKVLYDAAHAFGEELDGTCIGCFGDLSMFSFHATKVFHTIEGGGLACHDEATMKKLMALKNFGQYTAEDVGEIGGNAKMNEFQAAMGLCNLRHVKDQIARRAQVVARYRALLSGIPGFYLCPERPDVKPNYAYFPVVVDPVLFGEDRDALCERLQDKNIFPRKYFYPLTSHFRCYKGRFPLQGTPVAERMAERVLTLPLYSDMTVDDAEYICCAILEGKR
ncbi:DegT/DnrJ/EryC1/StrS family aminotransferase [Oscillospiraceae bacterium MB24-C1]|nr:DegT/DnrJ/EryC1/StrS family aminotransferase [Oscillospiraceae bacterium MB24-C1]